MPQSPSKLDISRRNFIQTGTAAMAGLGLSWKMTSGCAAAEDKPFKVAAVITEFTHRSHAHVILENFLEPYLFNGKKTASGMNVVSLYVDQYPDGDMSREVAKQYGINIYPTVGEALCDGGERLAVDAVLSIGEHGNYPHNEKGQHMYPRKRFFDGIVEVFRDSSRTAPVFSDKHLSYRWDFAKEMYDTAQSMDFALMAGSSVPLAERWPPLELPKGAKIEAAVSIHGGGVESYDFHGLEVLQSMIEARAGGETGIQEVQFLEGDALWQAAEKGLWSIPVAEAAMAAELGPGQPPLRQLMELPQVNPGPPHGILLTYKDGLKAMCLKVGGSAMRWNFACQLAGESKPCFTRFYVGPWDNRNLFKALSHSIQTHFRNGQAPYPVERTLLVTGILDASMQSRFEGGTPQQTPQLGFAYEPRDYREMREMGASWKILHEEIPETQGIDPNGSAI